MRTETAKASEEQALDRAQEFFCDRFVGLLFGTAVGDALGLPAENMSARRIERLWKGRWKMRFIFGKGMVSDDTEHTLMVAQALLQQPVDAREFQKLFASKLRWWFVALPAGVGLATAKACLRLWIGISPDKAGVKSGGNGPSMRSAIIGAYFADDERRRREIVTASSRLTHRAWQAEVAALAVAECAALAINSRQTPKTFDVLAMLRSVSTEGEWQSLIERMEVGISGQLSVREFAKSMGLEKGVSGYSLHTVPVAIYSWLRHPGDARSAIIHALACGGDTDSVGAIVGALAGATAGQNGIPDEWRGAIFEWPRSLSFMQQVGTRLADQRVSNKSLGPVRFFWPAVLLRNVVFLLIVLGHGLRRLAPPY